MKFVHGIIIAVGLLVAANLALISEDLTKAEVMMAIGASVPVCHETSECYIPYAVTVVTGGTVTWINNDVTHTVTAGNILEDISLTGTEIPGGFASGLIQSGHAYSHTFEEAGEYPYFCWLHPWMQGVVVVW